MLSLTEKKIAWGIITIENEMGSCLSFQRGLGKKSVTKDRPLRVSQRKLGLHTYSSYEGRDELDTLGAILD